MLTTPHPSGAPLSCRPDTICLQDYKKEKFHRLNIVCADLTVILGENGDFVGRNVSYDSARCCVTWRDGILSDCAVTETDDKGRRTDLSVTYICTTVFHTSTPRNPTPGDLMLTVRTPHPRRHCFLLFAVGLFICFLHFLVAKLRKSCPGADCPSEGDEVPVSRPWIWSYIYTM
ncbi:uncharacterized protein ACNLHF_028437 isoform 2-T3 [Anomaloglossus baeobatrachus]